MNEKAVQGAGQLIDYGVLGIFCLLLLAAFVFVAVLVRNKYERHLKEKDEYINKLEQRLDQQSKELAALRDKIENRLSDLLDECGNAIHENSKALYEMGSMVSSVVGENKGVLLSIHEFLKANK